MRNPLGGRGFESFSPDPYLNGTIAASYINGLQSKGVGATIKHYVANDQEFERYVVLSATYRVETDCDPGFLQTVCFLSVVCRAGGF